MSHSQHRPNDPESDLRESWSIGPLRPWLMMIAQRELPGDLRGRIDPSDLVQQTLLDAWNGQSAFQGTSHGQRLTWLRVILRRVVLQQRRRLLQTQKRGQGAERALVDAIDQSSLRIEQLAVGEQPLPDEVVENAEQSLQVTSALERLSPDYRRVIELRHFEQQSYESVAAAMDRTPEAARMLWVRALVQLRREFDQ